MVLHTFVSPKLFGDSGLVTAYVKPTENANAGMDFMMLKYEDIYGTNGYFLY